MAKLQLRLPDAIHRKIRKIAQRENLSINQFLVNSISNEIIRYETMHFFTERAKNFNEHDFLQALQEIPAVEPEEHDKLSIPHPANS